MYFGLSSFQVSRIFQGWGDKLLGPVLIILGLVMFGVIKININAKNETLEKLKALVATKGYLGSLFLGMLFALAFCPYSGVLFFGILTPLILKSQEALVLPLFFALGTGIPVIIFSFIIAFSMQKMSRAFAVVTKVEKITRFVVASTFMLVGIYYMRYLIAYLISL
jgi:cytochrome c biogenesis protein CcdA